MQNCIAINGACENKSVLKNLCRTHYDEMVELGIYGGKVPCGITECDKFAVVRGYCRRHYQALRRDGKVTQKTCSVCWFPVVGSSDRCEIHLERGCSKEGCTGVARARGMCNKHYQKERRERRS